MKHFTPTIILATLCLSACATATPYNPPPLAKNEAQVIVYRTAIPSMSASVALNGEKVCRLPFGKHVVLNVEGGSYVTLTHGQLLDWRTSSYSLTAMPGQRYYVKLTHNWGGALGVGFGGMLGNAAVTNEAGFVFRDGTEEEAMATKEACRQ